MSVWLVEMEIDGKIGWWQPHYYMHVSWTFEASEAVRFAGKADAEYIIRAFEIPKAKATEHIFMED